MNINQVPYLRTSRQFPRELDQLCIEVNRSYLDIAYAVNNRTIAIFPSDKPAVTGESWYLRNNQKQQTLRKIYPFGSIAPGAELDIPTGLINVNSFVRIWGTATTIIPDFRPIPILNPGGPNSDGMTILVGPIAGQQQIRIVVGATAPAVTSGVAVLEYLSNV